MNCQELGRWIGPLLDGELDARNTVEVQAHLAGCPACQRRYEVQSALASNLRRMELAYDAPPSLRQRIGAALEAELRVGAAVASEPTRYELAPTERVSSTREAQVDRQALDRKTLLRTGQGSSRFGRWLMWAGWPVALAASALLATLLLQQRSLQTNEIVAAHVRSLLADHLSDVASTSHHTVKPWFAGKVDFSPPVPDLASRGFELVGGRLDYVQGQPVAAVIYRKHGHIINVLACLPGHGLDKLPRSEHVQGYSLRSWKQSGLDLVAISDIDPRELATLEEGYEAPPPQTSD